MFHSLIIAFSTYSKIPMPQAEWSEKNMRYSICFFPLIGLIIGLLEWGALCLAAYLDFNPLLRAALLTVIPFLVTGGIHMDGFSDTSDARHSYRTREEKLEIMKDPHVGSFAVFCCVLYLLLYFSVLSEVRVSDAPALTGSFVISRILSGLAVTVFPKAKKDGMLRSTADASAKSVKWILTVELVFTVILMTVLKPAAGGAAAAAALLFFMYYRHVSVREFGGITGDLAGWFLQMTELILTCVIVISGKVI
ncbi:MAG: adenosylcobinamide-GDP ribazoletransferase [Lachnospiraceae bacterium]|nr:adenosylcobinamide-GDP ribazoletransferase [Lachnospiraceae bacterium]